MGLAFARASVLSALFAASGCSSLPNSSALPDGRIAAESPAGFVGFCVRFADQCDDSQKPGTIIKLTSHAWNAIGRVNAQENGAIQPMDDQRHYGRAEYWTISADGYGDCKDYALAKRRDLIRQGFPSGALRLAVVMTPEGDGHAVLTIATDRGDFVLDNLSPAILPWSSAPYRWIARQSGTDPWRWVTFQDPQPVLASAAPAPSARLSELNVLVETMMK